MWLPNGSFLLENMTEKKRLNQDRAKTTAARADLGVDQSLLSGPLIPLTIKLVKGAPEGTCQRNPITGQWEGPWRYWKDRLPQSTEPSISTSAPRDRAPKLVPLVDLSDEIVVDLHNVQMIDVLVDRLPDGSDHVVARAPAIPIGRRRRKRP